MMPWPYVMDSLKAIQALAYLLKQAEGNEYGYVDILKMFYKADIRSFKETAYPIARIGGDLPVPSKPLTRDWSKYFTRKHAKNPKKATIDLIEDPGIGKLCPYEIELLEDVFEEVDND